MMRPFLVLLLAAALHLPSQAAETPAAPARPPIADFFENPAFSGAKLSPNGNYLAVRMGGKGQRDRLAVVTLETGGVQSICSFADADIGAFEWVNDERLALTATDRSVGQGDANYAPGLYAIDRDGGNFIQLASRTGRAGSIGRTSGGKAGIKLLPWNTYMLGQRTAQNSDNIYVTSPVSAKPGKVDYVTLQLLNTVTGKFEGIRRPGNTMSWLLDYNGEPRLAITSDDGVQTIMYRDPKGSQSWRALAKFNAYTGGKSAFAPIGFGPDGTLYVRSDAGKDKSAVYTFNFATNRLSDKPVIQLEEYDFRGSLIMGKDKLLGIRYLTDALATSWLDQDMQATQEHIDTILPNTVNLLTLPSKPGSPWMLVEAYSDIFPLHTMLYNSATKQLTAIGASYPKIKPAQMAREQLVHYKARDGLNIPAWLTTPQGAGKNLPLIMLVHGGPYTRGGSWGWEAEAQFLASRGYLVLQPEFRGSTGFGNRHFQAGLKQWGLKMQDDIADGARWAIAQGLADPKRICIAGASYGGYSALMGLINDPDLYKCGVNWLGVTDINLMYDPGWFSVSDLTEEWKQYGMPLLIGDPVKDAEQLKATSPLQQAERIRQPLLLAYGGADLRVPLTHGTRFRRAVRENNPNVEWIEYEEEGHGWALPKNRIDFWSRVDKFLGKNIGAAP
jgi:dipeptidyl aminopeptidase/acylaminoacyl peptidase